MKPHVVRRDNEQGYPHGLKQMIRRFRHEVEKAQVLALHRQHARYQKPSETRRTEQNKRILKQRRRMRLERLRGENGRL